MAHNDKFWLTIVIQSSHFSSQCFFLFFFCFFPCRLELRDVIANTSIVTGVISLANIAPENSYAIDQIAVHPQYEPKGAVRVKFRY